MRAIVGLVDIVISNLELAAQSSADHLGPVRGSRVNAFEKVPHQGQRRFKVRFEQPMSGAVDKVNFGLGQIAMISAR